MREFFQKYKTLIFVLVILAIAAFFRLWQLSSIPPGLYPDVAINGNDALYSLKTGDFKAFYPENNGREGTMMWLIALSFSIFGVSIWSIKIVAAIIGILTVLGLYLLVKELFHYENGSRSIALLSSFFLAISFWHTNFSRIGFRAILLPFISVFAFYFLFKGFRQKSILDFIISGVFFGLGFYTYTPFRIISILFFLLLLWWFLYSFITQKEISFFYKSTFWFLLISFLITLPIGIYFINHAQDFASRLAGISIFSQENPFYAFGQSVLKHFAMFNFHGDDNWRHNFAGSPQLFWPVGILFLIGFVFVVFKGIYYAFYAPITDNSTFIISKFIMSRNYVFLILWFIMALLPGIFTYEGVPHALRTIGAIPVVFIFVGLASWEIYQFFEKNIKSPEGPFIKFWWGKYRAKKTLLLIASFFLLFSISFSEFNKYFFDWGKNKEVEGAFTKRFADIGYFLNSLPADYQKYVIVNEAGVLVPFSGGLPMPAQTIMFIENMKYGSLQSTYLLPKDLNQIKADNIKTVILPMAPDQNLFNELKQRFPQGEIEDKKEFQIYKVNF